MQQPTQEDLAQVLRDFALSLVRETPQGTLSRTSAATLSVLDRIGAQRITTLAHLEAVSQPAMTGLVQRLEASGLVTRSVDPADGRAALIEITASGTAALTDRRRRHDKAIAARISELSDADRDALIAATSALTHLTESHVQ